MEINVNPEEADFSINMPDIQEEEHQSEKEGAGNSLQRNKEWNKLRNGMWTGSCRKKLMTCNPKGAKMPWNNKEKIFMFSEGAIKAIYITAMQRRSGKVLETSSTRQMEYGTKVEPLIFEITKKNFLPNYPDLKLEVVGFKKSDEHETSGSSSDGVFYDINETPVWSYESKACTSWETHFDRVFEVMDESSIDFWQTQAQMEAWGVEYTIYAVAEPPENINKYLYVENILEYLEDFENECPITFQMVKRSPMHQEAMKVRMQIADEAIETWEKSGGNLRGIFYDVLERVKKDYLPKYVVTSNPSKSVLKDKKNDNEPEDDLATAVMHIRQESINDIDVEYEDEGGMGLVDAVKDYRQKNIKDVSEIEVNYEQVSQSKENFDEIEEDLPF